MNRRVQLQKIAAQSAAYIACLVVLRWEGLSRAVIAPLVVGYLSHLGADLLTTSGLRLAWPSSKRQAIGLCRTGSFAETVIVAGVAMISLSADILR